VQRPAFTPGTSDVTFETSSKDLCDPEEIKGTIPRIGRDRLPTMSPRRSSSSSFPSRTRTPPSGDSSSTSTPTTLRASREYEPLLEKRKLLAVAAYKSGNSRNIFDRFRLAIDAVVNLQKRFNVDSRRIYVSGFSGGARTASMLAVAYADLFSAPFRSAA
jgi:hypothetical protein